MRVLEFIPAGATGAVVRFAVRGTPVVARLPLGGAHNARNAAAALAVALAAGVPAVDAARGLESVALPPHRSAARAAGGRTILDDCYNANPPSMRAALSALAAAAAGGRRFAILGDMLELGAGAEAAHRALGHAAGLELSGVAAVGAFAQTIVDEARAAGLDPARAVAAAIARSGGGGGRGLDGAGRLDPGQGVARAAARAGRRGITGHAGRGPADKGVNRCCSTCSMRCANECRGRTSSGTSRRASVWRR